MAQPDATQSASPPFARRLATTFGGQDGDSSRPEVLKYIELKSGFADNGPAWIARVKVSKSGRTLYFNGKALKRARSGNIEGNHFDIETGDEYWVSGVKKRGANRHWAGSGVIFIEASAVEEFLRTTGKKALDPSSFQVIHDFPDTDPSRSTHSRTRGWVVEQAAELRGG